MQLSPKKGSQGIMELEAHTFSLRCLETPTGVKMFATAKIGSNMAKVNEFLAKVRIALHTEYNSNKRERERERETFGYLVY